MSAWTCDHNHNHQICVELRTCSFYETYECVHTHMHACIPTCMHAHTLMHTHHTDTHSVTSGGTITRPMFLRPGWNLTGDLSTGRRTFGLAEEADVLSSGGPGGAAPPAPPCLWRLICVCLGPGKLNRLMLVSSPVLESGLSSPSWTWDCTLMFSGALHTRKSCCSWTSHRARMRSPACRTSITIIMIINAFLICHIPQHDTFVRLKTPYMKHYNTQPNNVLHISFSHSLSPTSTYMHLYIHTHTHTKSQKPLFPSLSHGTPPPPPQPPIIISQPMKMSAEQQQQQNN